MKKELKNYLTITIAYWAFTLTDGAIRMLVVLYFHLLGYSPLEVAMLFLFYEFFGIVTNLVGGWLGARLGLNITMHLGMALQVFALLMLTVPDSWLTVSYVMFAQALSGIAKDLNKMSAKSGVKSLVKTAKADPKLFKWVAVLTGSKNALKGVGFFLGAFLLDIGSFRSALFILAGGLFLVWRTRHLVCGSPACFFIRDIRLALFADWLFYGTLGYCLWHSSGSGTFHITQTHANRYYS